MTLCPWGKTPSELGVLFPSGLGWWQSEPQRGYVGVCTKGDMHPCVFNAPRSGGCLLQQHNLPCAGYII